MSAIDSAPKPRRFVLERWATFALAGLIAWFYLWTVDPEGDRRAFSREGGGYYNLLARGFLKGQLSLDLPADPFLAALKNPYDSVARAGHGLHDATYFKGKYYLYFGVTPVLVLFAPIRLLTGWFIDESFASLVFSVAGFWLAVVTLRRVRERWLGAAPTWVMLAGVVALGLATMVPALLRRASIWEVPISCAYAMFMATLYCVLRAFEGQPGRGWLALASLAMGLCVGARPVYLGAAIVLIAPLGWLWRAQRADGRRELWKTAVVIFGPMACVGAGLAAYNFVRFGNPLEFGQTYQMAGEDVTQLKLFGLGYVPYNARIYLLSAAGLTPYFPFITVISPPPAPAGQFGIEDPYGLLPSLPWVILALASVVPVVWRRLGSVGLAASWFCAGAFCTGMATALTDFGFGGATGRYMVDFTPVFVFLGGVGALCLVTIGPRWWRRIASALVAILLGWSTAFGVLASMQHNDLLRAEHPAVYSRVAHAGNRVGHWIAPVRNTEVGPVELTVVFPRNAIGQVEPLVATGREFRADYVFVHYLAEDMVRFGFEHTSRDGGSGPPVRIIPGVPHEVRVSMGSLYPPRDHPYFDGSSLEEQRVRTRTLRVWLDGKIALERSTDFYDATERIPAIGTAGARPGFKRDFSGQIVSWKRLPDAPPGPTVVQTGALRLRLKFPAFAGRRNEPLLSTGVTGRGDLIYVIYADARHVSFGHDHWGHGGSQSAPVEIDPEAEQVIEVRCPPLLGAAAPPGWSLRLDGREVLANSEPFHPCEPGTVSVLANEIHASTAAMFFSGEARAVERVAP